MRSGVVVLLSVVSLSTASTPSRGQAGLLRAGSQVVLVGDSIRLGYAQGHRTASGKASSSARENGGDSATCSPTSTNGSSGRSQTSSI